MPRFSVIVPAYRVQAYLREWGGVLATTGRRLFDVFEQYDRIFAFLGRRPQPACRRPPLLRPLVDHLSPLFSRTGLLPRGCRTDLLRKARTHQRRCRSLGARLAPRPGLRHALVRLGLRRAFRGLLLATTLCRRAVKPAVKSLRALRAAALQLHHRVQPHRRVQPWLPLRAGRAGAPGRQRRLRPPSGLFPVRRPAHRAGPGAGRDQPVARPSPRASERRLPFRGVRMRPNTSRPTPTRPSTWRPSGRPGRERHTRTAGAGPQTTGPARGGHSMR
ncbi:hypothetical protein ACJ6WE_22940 [Streptomyces sp. MMS24-I31]|uniref:hypothetical protein n=1 Tax=Streptomyces sp. MMS24-I31 TaxID=3351563 RepID=UPI0038969DF9